VRNFIPVLLKVSALGLLLCQLSLLAQNNDAAEPSDLFEITVLDLRTNSKLERVALKFSNQVDTIFTDKTGLYEFENLSLFPDSVEFHKDGFLTQTFYIDGKGGSAQIILQTDYSNLQEVNVYGFSGGQSLATSPAAIHLIEQKEIQRSTTTNVAPILNKIPGVFVQTGALNTNRITIRGVGGRSAFATRNVRAYLEDIPLTDSGGETAIEDIDLETIGSIEVIKGPTSTQYGSGTGGTIIMKGAKADLNEHSVSGKVLVGSYGLLKSNLTYRINNEVTNAWVQFNKISSEGYRDNNNFDRTSYTGFIQAFSKNNGVLSLLINRTDFKAFIPSSLSLANALENPRQAAFIWDEANGFERYLETLGGLNWKNYRKHFTTSHSLSLRNNQSIERRPWDFLGRDLINFQLRSTISIKTGENSKLNLGYEYMNENLDHETMIDQILVESFINSVRTHNLFANFKAEFYENIFFETGWSNNRMKFKGNQDQGFFFRNNITKPPPTNSFRVALSRLSKNRRHTQYVSYNTGLINPSIEQIFGSDAIIRGGDRELQLLRSEKSRSAELGFRGKFRNFSYDLSAYSMKLRYRIDQSTRTSENDIIFDNRGNSTHQGIEAVLNWKTPVFQGPIKRIYLSASGNYGSFLFGDYPLVSSSTDGELITFTTTNLEGNILTGVPDLVANAEARLELSFGLNVRLHYQHVGSQALDDENTLFSDSHDEVNLTFDYETELSPKWTLAVNAGIRNLLDSDYFSMYSINAFGPPASARYYYPALPRNMFSGLKLTHHINR